MNLSVENWLHWLLLSWVFMIRMLEATKWYPLIIFQIATSYKNAQNGLNGAKPIA